MRIFTLLSTGLFILFVTVANGQFNKGDKLLGGNVSLGYGSNSISDKAGSFPNTSAKHLNTSLSPRLGWATKTNQLQGVSLNVGYNYTKNITTPNQHTTFSVTTVGLGYFFRNYRSFSDKVGWFMEYGLAGDYNWNTSTSIYNGTTSTNKSTGYSIGANVYPGFYYKVHPKIFVDASFGGLNATYSRSKNSSVVSKAFDLNVTFPNTLALGVQFVL